MQQVYLVFIRVAVPHLVVFDLAGDISLSINVSIDLPITSVTSKNSQMSIKVAQN